MPNVRAAGHDRPDSLRDACTDMLAKRDVFTPYGQMLLDEMCDWAKTIDFDALARAISSPEYAGYKPAVAAWGRATARR
ncbi:hypothetical protein AB0F13_00950 [Streptomyces sp. NPDC026206]|uniref:hypothetical protein n=1 Tax=Streptomyces sp. NPDC026206 TaxID=3157089 RepID=UPI00340FDBE0